MKKLINSGLGFSYSLLKGEGGNFFSNLQLQKSINLGLGLLQIIITQKKHLQINEGVRKRVKPGTLAVKTYGAR